MDRRHDGLALTGICLGFFLVLLDATIVNVALTAIGRALDGTLTAQQWVLNAYTVAFAALMLTAGGLADRWGARRCYLGGLGLFAVATVLCALAPTTGTLIAARALQGVGAAALVPCSLSLIAARFPAGPARARALALWGGVSGIGLAAGPVLGGLLVTTAGWRTVFLVAVPPALVAIALVARTVEETPRRPARADMPGQLLAIAALATLVGAFTTTSTTGWLHPAVLALLAAGVVLSAAFLAVERRVEAPLLPLGLFRDRGFSAATAIGALFNFGLYGTVLCLALFVEDELGETARSAGLVLLPLTAGIAVAAVLSSRVGARFGLRAPLLLGLGAGGVGATALAFAGPATPVWTLAAIGAVLGGVGFAMPAMTALALSSCPADSAGLGAAVLNTSRQAGGAFGVALLGSLLAAPEAGLRLHVPLAVVAVGYGAALLIARSARAASPATRPRTPAAASPPARTSASR